MLRLRLPAYLRCRLRLTKLVVLSSNQVPALTSVRSLAFVAVLVAFAPGRAQSDEGLQAHTVGVPMGLRSYAPGRWGLVKVELDNNGDQEGMLPAAVHLKENTSLRFGRDIWVPPHSRRMTSIPVHLASDSGDRATQATFEGRAAGKEFSTQARLNKERLPM